MLAIYDIEHELPFNPGELFCPRVGNNDNRELLGAALHHAGVLEDKCALAPVECSRNTFDGYITGRSVDTTDCGQHFAFAHSIQIAKKTLVERHPAKGGAR